MQTLTINAAAEVAGVAAQTVRNWVALGLLRPAQPGTTGTGRGHRLNMAQVLALAAAAVHRELGADPGRVAGVVRLLAGMSVERLEAELAAGRTYPVPAALLGVEPRPACWLPGMLVRPPADDPTLTPAAAAMLKKLDLAPLWERVRRDAERLARRPAPTMQRPRRPARAKMVRGA
jgi:hypothetical protein